MGADAYGVGMDSAGGDVICDTPLCVHEYIWVG